MKRLVLITLTSICVLCSIMVLVLFKPKESSASFQGFNYKDITQVYDKIKLEDLVCDIKCEDDKCYYDKKEVLYDIKYNHSVGKQNVKLTLVYDNYSYTKEFDVLVLDNISPTINLTEEEINIKYKEEFNPLDYILNITDNFDEDLINKVVVDNKVNINKTGTYEVVYTVSDDSDNVASKILKVNVINENKKSEINNNLTVNKPIIKDKDKDEKIENNPNSSVGNDNKTNVPIINDSKDNKEEVPIVATDFKTLINNTKLNDVKEDPVLDALTKPVYDAVITPGMSNYDKLLAIYGYFTRNIKFGDIINYDNQSIINYTKNKRYSFQDSASILYGGQSLRNKKGTSRSNAMAFTLVAKRLGFDIKTAYENTSYGYTINYWSMIELNGINYVFDINYEVCKGPGVYCLSHYKYFAKPITELERRYSNYKVLNSLNYNKIKDLHVIQEISGAFEDKKDDSLNTDLKSIVVPEVIKLKLNDSIHIKDFVEGNGIYHCYISLGGNYLVKEDFTSNVIEKDILFDKPGKYKLNIGIWDIHSVAHIRYFYNIIVE